MPSIAALTIRTRFWKPAIEEPEAHRNILNGLPPISDGYDDMRGSDTDFTTPHDNYGPGATGSFRTLCVRTCDGSFFPISSDASPADFQRDAETCRQRCPGAETALYYHALTTEETDQMVSAATGEPYADLPSAFAYKTRDRSQNGQCGCRPLGQTAIQQSTPDNGKGVVDLRATKKTQDTEATQGEKHRCGSALQSAGQQGPRRRPQLPAIAGNLDRPQASRRPRLPAAADQLIRRCV